MSDVHSLYPVSVRWEAEKRGLASSPDHLPPLAVAAPPAFGGPAGVWSPEHLFVLAAASCWMTTFLTVAKMSGLEVRGVDCSGEGRLEKGEDHRFWIAHIVLRPRVTVAGEHDRARALPLIEKAERACLIRNSVRTQITLESEVIDLDRPGLKPATPDLERLVAV